MSRAKSQEKSPLWCVLHLSSVQEQNVCPFTEVRWGKYRECLGKWLDLPGESGDIARSRYHSHAGIGFTNIPPSAGYHPTCYRRFTDKKRQLASKKRCLHAFEGATEVSAVDASVQKPGVLSSPKKSLRSRSALPISSQGHILPRICIICKKESRYLNRVHGPKRDKLVKAETLTAGTYLAICYELNQI